MGTRPEFGGSYVSFRRVRTWSTKAVRFLGRKAGPLQQIFRLPVGVGADQANAMVAGNVQDLGFQRRAGLTRLAEAAGQNERPLHALLAAKPDHFGDG